MNRWIYRGLATAGFAGAVWLLGTANAYAHDGSAHTRASYDSSRPARVRVDAALGNRSNRLLRITATVGRRGSAAAIGTTTPNGTAGPAPGATPRQVVHEEPAPTKTAYRNNRADAAAAVRLAVGTRRPGPANGNPSTGPSAGTGQGTHEGSAAMAASGVHAYAGGRRVGRLADLGVTVCAGVALARPAMACTTPTPGAASSGGSSGSSGPGANQPGSGSSGTASPGILSSDWPVPDARLGVCIGVSLLGDSDGQVGCGTSVPTAGRTATGSAASVGLTGGGGTTVGLVLGGTGGTGTGGTGTGGTGGTGTGGTGTGGTGFGGTGTGGSGIGGTGTGGTGTGGTGTGGTGIGGLALGACLDVALGGDATGCATSDAGGSTIPGSNGPGSGNSNGGDPSGGDPNGGDPNGGDPSGGDSNGGDPSGGDPNGGGSGAGTPGDTAGGGTDMPGDTPGTVDSGNAGGDSVGGGSGGDRDGSAGSSGAGIVTTALRGLTGGAHTWANAARFAGAGRSNGGLTNGALNGTRGMPDSLALTGVALVGLLLAAFGLLAAGTTVRLAAR